jgi:hypothetical protein
MFHFVEMNKWSHTRYKGIVTHKLVVLVVGVDAVHNHEGKEACGVTVGHEVQNARRHNLCGGDGTLMMGMWGNRGCISMGEGIQQGGWSSCCAGVAGPLTPHPRSNAARREGLLR